MIIGVRSSLNAFKTFREMIHTELEKSGIGKVASLEVCQDFRSVPGRYMVLVLD